MFFYYSGFLFGHFIFGPLESETLYLVKVYKDSIKLRELEIKTE